jgi:hypothetical protein
MMEQIEEKDINPELKRPNLMPAEVARRIGTFR